ncbi:peptidoglycan/LPS O-acetylase OafA/YrhL [Saccharopolyspora lacisalsi]|uniref:Peptidoglycan/LPS O-acetylase OafA/YrhL n=1 Tax=Halosaccharopolyspora lacisalsi TaxID=1000566 RepID=A0A839E1V7_9PSEU|nr:hypothetical protein [Halosaccharopolyspora lacisalsi]MBA8825391.1 peptidoglycan/LPS O-acetylase OafA/YrhL [Halosaccharopolyspora lacisalsi]
MTEISSESTSQRDTTPPVSQRDRLERLRLARSGPWLLGLLALVPPVMMLREVLNYSQMHFYDYWWVLLDITNPDGSLRPWELLNFRNEHPFVLPTLLFWLSARFGDGLNQPLGALIIVFGVASVLLVWRLLPSGLGRWPRAGLVVATSTLVFNPHGIHNYVRSMSGASWLLALMLVLAALLAMQRGRPLVAVALGLLASISYGTSFALWPGLVLMAWLRGDRRRWVITPAVVGVLVVATWFVLRGPQGGGDSPTGDPAQVALTGLSMLGLVWTGSGVAIALLAAVAGLAVLALHVPTSLSPENRRSSAPWWGLVVYALGCAVMISGSRAAFGTEAGLQSRYNSMAAALWIALLVIVVSWPRVRRPGTRAVVLGSTVVATVTLSVPMAQTVREDSSTQRLLAVAARVGATDTLTSRFPRPQQLLPRLRDLGHYPFSDEFGLGCGQGIEVGARVNTSKWRTPGIGSYREPLPNGRNVLLNVEHDKLHDDTRLLKGWAISGIERARCVVVLDAADRVVGGGVVDLPRPQAETKTPGVELGLGYRAVVPAGSGPLRLAFRFPDGWWKRPLSRNPEVANS